MPSSQITLTHDELKALMSDAVSSAFRQMGMEPSSPLEMQRDMAYLRRWRKAVDSAQSTTFKVIITTLVMGLLGAIWVGFSQMTGAPPK